jgi:polar amino acid transport system substrate-binding protein
MGRGRFKIALAGIAALMFIVSMGPAAETAGNIEIPPPGTSPTVDAIMKAHVFRAGVALTAPWLLADPQTHQYVGPSIDLAQGIAQALGAKVEYVSSNWDVIIAALQSNKFDAAIAPLFATPARMQVVDFVNYSEAGSCYASLKTNQKVTDLASLNNPKVTVETYTGTGNEQGFVKKYPQAHDYSITPPLGGAVNIDDVLNGRVDALVINSTDAVWLADQYPQVKITPQDPNYCVSHPDIPFPIGLAYRKGDTGFGKLVQQVVNNIKAQMDADMVKYSAPKFMKGQ